MDEIWDLIGSVFEGFSTFSFKFPLVIFPLLTSGIPSVPEHRVCVSQSAMLDSVSNIKILLTEGGYSLIQDYASCFVLFCNLK